MVLVTGEQVVTHYLTLLRLCCPGFYHLIRVELLLVVVFFIVAFGRHAQTGRFQFEHGVTQQLSF